MKQLVILSGKGGTGKTSLAAAFAHLASAGPSPLHAVIADADVDAANLELVLQPTVLEKHPFMGGSLAVIDQTLCQACGTCAQVCRFEAVIPPSDSHPFAYQIDPLACEGCAACVYQCPEHAIHMQDQLAGHWFRSQSAYGPLFHAELRPAQENSGKLVTLVKQQARLQGLDTQSLLVIVDGPPGIGCPVISAAAGADLALIVTEPTAAGIHDMARALDLTSHFRLPSLVCINKADIYPQGADQIRAACYQRQVEVVGEIPYDTAVSQAMLSAQPVTLHQPAAPASLAIIAIWQRLAPLLNPPKGT